MTRPCARNSVNRKVYSAWSREGVDQFVDMVPKRRSGEQCIHLVLDFDMFL